MVRGAYIIALLLGLLPLVSHGNGVVKETVWFLKEDGRHYLSYSTVRTDSPRYDLYLDKSAALEDYLYIFPNAYQWDVESDPKANILHFSQSDYATISLGDLDARVGVTMGITATGPDRKTSASLSMFGYCQPILNL
jgi:hypothetical protein